MEATCASHTGGWDVPRLEWFHGLVNKQRGEEAEPARGARPTPPVKGWGGLGLGWPASVPEWLRADSTCVQGWDWPGQRLEGGPPEPTGVVDSGKRIWNLPRRSRWATHRKTKDLRGLGVREQLPLPSQYTGDGEVPTQPQTPTFHCSSPKCCMF